MITKFSAISSSVQAARASLTKVLSFSTSVDVVVVGAGHNGLVASTLLANMGLKVAVYEEKSTVGGACKTEFPFKKAPQLGQSTGAYLLGVMPPELMQKLDVKIPVKRRDPHYFLPTTGNRYLLFGSDQEAMKRQFLKFFSEDDWKANCRLQEEIGSIRDDVAPTWLSEPMSVEATAEKYVRSGLRQAFIDLCNLPVSHYIERFGFRSNLLKAMYAVTDGFSGLNGGWDSPGTGMNFLAHNMCRLPGADGTWMVVEGGMGVVTGILADRARRAGASIQCDAPVQAIEVEGGHVTGVRLADGSFTKCKAVVVNADPFRLRALAGAHHFDTTFNSFLDGLKKEGTTMKVNMALKGLPKFSCLPENVGQHSATIHLLPDNEDTIIPHLKQTFEQVQAGQLPDFPTIEWYIHTTVDPKLRDASGHHNSALFVQWVPYSPNGQPWTDEVEAKYVQHLLSICDRFAPGTSDLVADTFTLTPPKIEQHFGISHGHIHHIDNSFGFDQRFPYRTPIQGLYSASAGTHPAGSVIGCAGHNAAMVVAKDMGKVR